MKLSVKIGKNSFYIYSILVGIGSILFSGNVFTGYIFTAVQILFILVCFISRMRSKSVCFLFISIILGLSYDMGLGSMGFEWYTIKTIKLLGVNLGIWIMVPFFAVAITNKSVTAVLVHRGRSALSKFVRIIFWINLVALLTGILNVFVFNDNNIQSMENYNYSFWGLIYMPVLCSIMPAVILYWRFIVDEKFPIMLKDTLNGIMVSVIISCFVSLIVGKVGYKLDSTKIPWVSVIGCFAPYLIIFPLYKDYKYSIKWLALAILGLFCGMYFFANGKMFLSFGLLAFIVLAELVNRENRSLLLLLLVASPMVVWLLIQILAKVHVTNVMMSKINYAISFVNVFNPNWWNMIPPSPKWRLVELINITREYMDKPYLLFLGKGLLGTTKDYTGYLSNFIGNLASAGSDEWGAGLFYSMHEAINSLYLTSGALGLWSLVWVLKQMIKYYKVSPFVFVGCFWYLIYYGYSFTITLYGIAAIMLGLYDAYVNERAILKFDEVAWGL